VHLTPKTARSEPPRGDPGDHGIRAEADPIISYRPLGDSPTPIPDTTTVGGGRKYWLAVEQPD
jgi:hypothetical protein